MSQTSSLPISEGTRHRPVRKMPARQLAGETVLVDPRDRRVILLNKVGALVWAAVERGAAEGEIVAEVVQRFQVGEARARVDVDQFLTNLEASGLVVRAEDK